MTNPISLPELRAMALKDGHPQVSWPTKRTLMDHYFGPERAAFIAALSPDVVLRLVAVAEAAENIRTLASVQVKEYPDGKRFVSFDPHAVNLLPLMVALAGLSGNSSGDGCPCCQGGKGEPCMTCVMAVRMARMDEP